jgi:L-ascorbate metabolism protein UlaG (beta-lactamase superfamily)
LITLGGKIVYHTGDTGLFYDMKLIGEMNPIDLMFLPIGDNFTMGIDDAAKAVELAGPKTVVPIHYKTWDIINAEPEEFKRKLSKLSVKVAILKPGETIEIA